MSESLTAPQTPRKSKSPQFLHQRSKTMSTILKKPSYSSVILSSTFPGSSKFGEIVEVIINSQLVEGKLFVILISGHVYLEFQPEIQSVSFEGSPRKSQNLQSYFSFCIEDTPSYSIIRRLTETEILFHTGREMDLHLYPIVFKRDGFYSFCEVLKTMNVIVGDGFVRVEKKRLPYMVDIVKYINELQYDDRLVKRTNWIKQIRADCTEKINKSNHWDRMNEIKIRKGLFYRGVEEDCRCDIWKKCLGFNFEEGTYNVLKQQVSLLLDIQIQHNEKLSIAFKQIGKDIGRTHITQECLNNWALSNSQLKNVIERLLKCWMLYNLDGGYQQGMSDILVGLMEYCKTEYETFGLFIKVMEMMSSVYLKNVTTDIYVNPIVKVIDPEFHGYLKMMGITYSFMYKWIVLLFRRDFPRAACVRIWDAIFAYPENKLHFFIAASLLTQHYEIIMSNRFDLDDMSIFFQQMENKFDDNIYIDADIAVSNFRVNASDKEQLLVFS